MRLGQLYQFLQGNQKLGRSRCYTTVSSFIIILSGFILYVDTILGLFFNLDISVNTSFVTLRGTIYGFESAIAPLLIIIGSQMKPYWISYSVPMYAYLNVLIGYIIMASGYEVYNFWLFRIAIIIFCVVLFIALTFLKNFLTKIHLIDDIKDSIIDSIKREDLKK
jgi:hypothetical protein